jgi:nicotinate-nucleotide adenylyltransferase
MKSIALFGGTFDPIHNGHVKSAIELKQRLLFDELRLLPCYQPPHRQLPGGSSDQRLAMVELAIADTCLLVDDHEYKRDRVSFSVETLEQLRQGLGSQVSLSWVMGADAFLEFDHWYRWQDFLSLAHIVVIARPGDALPIHGPVAELLKQYRANSVDELKQKPFGTIWFESLTPYSISATAIRVAIGNKQNVGAFIPASVLEYIQSHQLYQG